jgi:hypothetical protein
VTIRPTSDRMDVRKRADGLPSLIPLEAASGARVQVIKKKNGCSNVGYSRSRASTSETGGWLGKGASQRRPANEGINKRLA